MELERASTSKNQDETPSWTSYGNDQVAVENWVRTRFNDKVFESLEERTLRVMEEGIELFDSEAKDREAARAKAHRTVDAVFDRAKGDQNQEAGGVIVTLLAYCAAKLLRLDKIADAEIARIHKLPKDHFRKRQAEKAALGVAMLPE